MEATSRSSIGRPWRLLLLACAIGFLWALAAVLLQPGAASAAEDDDAGSGLLGLVGKTVSTVSDVADTAVGTVDSAATAVVETVAQVVTPVVAVVPEPVQAPVAKAVSTAVSKTVGAVGSTTKAVDTLVSGTTKKAAGAVSDLTSGTPLAPVVGEIGAVDPVLPGVGGVTVIDEVVDVIPPGAPAVPATPGTDPAVPANPNPSVTDATAPGTAIAPGTIAALLAAPGLLPGGSGDFAVASAAGAVAQTLLVAQASALESLRLALVAPFTSAAVPGSAGIGAIALSFGALAVLAAAWPRIPHLVRARAAPGDREPPGAPAHDTDVSPD